MFELLYFANCKNKSATIPSSEASKNNVLYGGQDITQDVLTKIQAQGDVTTDNTNSSDATSAEATDTTNSSGQN